MSGIPVVSESIGLNPSEVAIVIISGNFILVTVARYLVRVVITVTAVLYVWNRGILVLPSWVF